MTSFQASFFLKLFFSLFEVFEFSLLRLPLIKFNEILFKIITKATLNFKSRIISQW